MLAFFLACIVTSPLVLTTTLWLVFIRRYLRRRGQAVITCVRWELSAIGDWTMARITAKECGENPWFVWAFPLSLLWWPAAWVTVSIIMAVLSY